MFRGDMLDKAVKSTIQAATDTEQLAGAMTDVIKPSLAVRANIELIDHTGDILGDISQAAFARP